MIRAVVFVIALAACQKSEAPVPDCTVIMKHLESVLKQGVDGHIMFGTGKADVDECNARKLTDTQKRCLLDAKTTTQVASCNAGKSDEVPRVPDEAKGAPAAKTH